MVRDVAVHVFISSSNFVFVCFCVNYVATKDCVSVKAPAALLTCLMWSAALCTFKLVSLQLILATSDL